MEPKTATEAMIYVKESYRRERMAVMVEKIIRIAQERGQYLIPKTHFGGDRSDERLVLDSLVASGHAQWLAGGMGPGIRLTGKPWPDPQMKTEG